MKVVYFMNGWSHGFEQFENKEQVYGVDLVTVGAERYLYNPKNPFPNDSKHFFTYNREDLRTGYRGITCRRNFDDYLMLEQKMLDRIDENEDIIVYSEYYDDDSLEFFEYLLTKKKFKLHIIELISADYESPDYHERLRILSYRKINSICYFNESLYCEESEDGYQCYKEPLFDEMEHIINAVKNIQGDSFMLYNSEKKEYFPFELPPECGDSMLEYITPVDDKDICQRLYEYRRDFAKKHNKDYDEKPCTECEFHDECGHVCPECDSEASYLWNSVYIYPYYPYDDYDEPDKPVIPYPYEYEDVEGKINGVDRMRIDTDGNGIRSLVLMAGCALNCKYCGNKYFKEIFPDTETVDINEIHYYLQKDGIYFEMTNGGITFGGGEPLMQPDFIHNFCRKYPMWSVNIETSLNCPWEYVERIAEDIDEWYIDIKDMNSEIYRAYTGADNTAVIENLQRLIKLVPPEKICVRIPLIKDFNGESDVEESVRRLREMGFVWFDRFEYKV